MRNHNPSKGVMILCVPAWRNCSWACCDLFGDQVFRLGQDNGGVFIPWVSTRLHVNFYLFENKRHRQKMRPCALNKREKLNFIFSWRFKFHKTDTHSFSACPTGRWRDSWDNFDSDSVLKSFVSARQIYTGVWAESVVLFWGSFFDNEKGGNILIFEYLKRISKRWFFIGFFEPHFIEVFSYKFV